MNNVQTLAHINKAKSHTSLTFDKHKQQQLALEQSN